ncbi:MAG TPA: hypothetical protein VNJ01_02550 [Bacteriovoracaceae bacterium]|nr:hypothetical protein [Bacteriovoracaceae bacterium]
MKQVFLLAAVLMSSLAHAQADFEVVADCVTTRGYGYPFRSHLIRQTTDNGYIYKYMFFAINDPRRPSAEYGLEVLPFSSRISGRKYNVAFGTEDNQCRVFLSGNGPHGESYIQGCGTYSNYQSRCTVNEDGLESL